MIVSKRVIITAALIAAVSLVLGAATPPAALAAGTRIVDDNYPSPGACKGANYATIQAAVDSFGTGQSGTIKVCEGLYIESVSISNLGKIKLMGSEGATIVPPGTSPLIAATNTTRLTVQGFTLDGWAAAISDGMIFLQNSSGVVTKNVFQNSLGSHGVTSLVSSGGAATLKVTNNDFIGVLDGVYTGSGGTFSAKVTGNDFTGVSEGMTITGALGSSTTATVTGNRLQGAGGPGITVQGTNKARVSGNKVEGFSIGIVLRDSSLAKVSKNKVLSTVYGIYLIGSTGNANSNKVQGNTIVAAGGNFIGIYVAAGAGRTADFNQITGNTITDPGSAYTSTTGIRLSNSGGSMNKTAVKSNKLVNMDTPYYHTGDTNTVISGNKCTPATPCVIP